MSRTGGPRPATGDTARLVDCAVAHLRHARWYAKKADCPGLLKKIRSAIKSGGGAERHLIGRLQNSTKSK